MAKKKKALTDDEAAAIAAVNRFVSQKTKGVLISWLDAPFAGLLAREGGTAECMVHAVVLRAGIQPLFYVTYHHPENREVKTEAVKAADVKVKERPDEKRGRDRRSAGS